MAKRVSANPTMKQTASEIVSEINPAMMRNAKLGRNVMIFLKMPIGDSYS
jgi:hypothetical protein